MTSQHGFLQQLELSLQRSALSLYQYMFIQTYSSIILFILMCSQIIAVECNKLQLQKAEARSAKAASGFRRRNINILS